MLTAHPSRPKTFPNPNVLSPAHTAVFVSQRYLAIGIHLCLNSKYSIPSSNHLFRFVFPSFYNMGMLGLFCFKVILAEILMVQVMAEKSEGSELNLFGFKAQNKVSALGVVARVSESPESNKD